jgi:hypothetical protein
MQKIHRILSAEFFCIKKSSSAALPFCKRPKLIESLSVKYSTAYTSSRLPGAGNLGMVYDCGEKIRFVRNAVGFLPSSFVSPNLFHSAEDIFGDKNMVERQRVFGFGRQSIRRTSLWYRVQQVLDVVFSHIKALEDRFNDPCRPENPESGAEFRIERTPCFNITVVLCVGLNRILNRASPLLNLFRPLVSC